MTRLGLVLIGVVGLTGPGPLSSPARAEDFRLSLPLTCGPEVGCVVQNYVDTDPGPQARDYRCSGQTYQGHNGVDIRLPDMAAQRKGVGVLAAAAGTVLRLRDAAPDISIRAEGAPSVAGQECGNGLVIDHGQGWETQYCHMARGSLVVKAGQKVARGARLGRVGLSGMTEFPHLHLTVRHQGRMVDPFGPDLAAGQCNPIAGVGLWDGAAMRTLAYQAGAVLNAGFSGSVVTMEGIEAGGLPPPAPDSAFLIAWVRAIHLQAGDVQTLTVTGPDGKALARASLPPLDRDKAQTLTYAGIRRPVTGWIRGGHTARYEVVRSGRVVLARDFRGGL